MPSQVRKDFSAPIRTGASAPTGVAPELAERVRTAIGELGYRPSAAAQGLARGRSGTIGVLVPDLANPYFHDIIKSVSIVAREAGSRVLVMDSNEGPDGERELAEDLIRYADGLLLCSPRMPRADLAALAGRATPMLVRGRVGAGACCWGCPSCLLRNEEISPVGDPTGVDAYAAARRQGGDYGNSPAVLVRVSRLPYREGASRVGDFDAQGSAFVDVDPRQPQRCRWQGMEERIGQQLRDHQERIHGDVRGKAPLGEHYADTSA